MSQKGIENVYALLGGTQAWKNAGYPMEGSGAPAAAPANTAPGANVNAKTAEPVPVRTSPQMDANGLKSDTPKP